MTKIPPYIPCLTVKLTPPHAKLSLLTIPVKIKKNRLFVLTLCKAIRTLLIVYNTT